MLMAACKVMGSPKRKVLEGSHELQKELREGLARGDDIVSHLRARTPSSNAQSASECVCVCVIEKRLEAYKSVAQQPRAHPSVSDRSETNEGQEANEARSRPPVGARPAQEAPLRRKSDALGAGDATTLVGLRVARVASFRCKAGANSYDRGAQTDIHVDLEMRLQVVLAAPAQVGQTPTPVAPLGASSDGAIGAEVQDQGRRLLDQGGRHGHF